MFCIGLGFETPLGVEYTTSIHVGNNLDAGKPLNITQRRKSTLTIADVMHLYGNYVCQHGIYILKLVCNCIAKAYLVRTISSLIQIIAKEFRKLHNELDDYVTA